MRGTQVKRLRRYANHIAKEADIQPATALRAMKIQFKHQASRGINKQRNVQAAGLAYQIIKKINNDFQRRTA